MRQKFTHKGWFGFAPVYLADIDSRDNMVVAARYRLDFLVSVNAFIFQMLGAEQFPFRITGEMNPPIWLD